jgi:hypothetical protein
MLYVLFIQGTETRAEHLPQSNKQRRAIVHKKGKIIPPRKLLCFSSPLASSVHSFPLPVQEEHTLQWQQPGCFSSSLVLQSLTHYMLFVIVYAVLGLPLLHIQQTTCCCSAGSKQLSQGPIRQRLCESPQQTHRLAAVADMGLTRYIRYPLLWICKHE